MIEKLEIEKLQKGEMVDNFTLIENKINEIIDNINGIIEKLNETIEKVNILYIYEDYEKEKYKNVLENYKISLSKEDIEKILDEINRL